MSSVARRQQRPQNWLQRIFNLDFGSSRSRARPTRCSSQLGRGLAAVSGDLGPPAADQDSGRRGAQARLDRQARGPASHPPRPAGRRRLRRQAGPGGVGLSDGPRPRQARRHRRQGDDRVAQPRRRAIMPAGSRSTWSAPGGLPATRTFDRYVVVDSGAAEAYLFDRDRIADRMRVIVGSPKTKTPMMAVLMRNAKANPYWNVPPELVRSLTAKKVKEQGLSYFQQLPLRGAVRLDRQRPPGRSQGRSTGRRSLRASSSRRSASASCRGRGIRWAR